MIVKPADVEQGGNWDGTSWDPNARRNNPNLQSTMDWAEHQRIVCDARSLVTPNRPELRGNSERDKFVTNAFFELQAAYVSRDVELYVTKGIHQPGNPHIQVQTFNSKLLPDGRRRPIFTFHLVLSAEPVAGLADKFQWKGVQFTVIGTHLYSWPEAAMRARRGVRSASISSTSPVLQRHLNAIAARQAAEEQRVRDAAAAARLASAKSVEEHFDNVALPAFKTKYSVDKSEFNPTKQGYAKFRLGTGQFNVKVRGKGYPIKYIKNGDIVFVGAVPPGFDGN